MGSTIPLFSAARANSGIDFLEPLKRVLDSHWYVMGSEVAGFEREFATYCGVDHCVGLGNGTDALELGLRALGVGAGDTVAMAANAGFYASTAARLIGAVPLYADIDPVTMTLCPDALRSVLQCGQAKAIVVTHLYGQMADMKAICAIAEEAGIPVVEDCAQSHGARRDWICGSFADVAAFSFYPTKNLGALGDGGAVVTRNPAIAEKVARLRQYGWGSKYSVEWTHGRNSRLDEIQAAILRQKLPMLDAWNARRREIAARYNEALEGKGPLCPASVGNDYVAHLYVLRVDNRTAFREHMRNEGIATDIHYPIPDHRQPAYLDSTRAVSLPHTERACESVVSLPCYPGLPDADVAAVVAAALGYFESIRGHATC